MSPLNHFKVAIAAASNRPDSGVSLGGLSLILALGAGVWLLLPVPSGLTPQAWQLFIVFIAAIIAVIANILPIFLAAVLALVTSVLTGLLTPAQAYSGFSQGFILLIAVAFLVARGVVKSGLGERIAYLLIARIGRTTLGLGYALVVTDFVIAPAFPSNTARSGVLFPVAQSVALGSGSHPESDTRQKTGTFLMMTSMAGLSISSALWLTAMAANPIGATMAAEHGIDITFGSWLLAASVPSLLAAAVLPWLLFRVCAPETKHTPEAPALARDKLARMGAMRRNEWIMGGTFIGLVVLWSLSKTLGIDATAIAFLGLFVVMASGIFTVKDLKEEGGTLRVFIWFGILYTLSTFLNRFGFMAYLGEQISTLVVGAPWPVAYVALLCAYVILHYLFVSQTAHMLALFPVFLAVGIEAGVPTALFAYMLLFATNFFSCITPQGSSANVIFVGSGYLTSREVYRYGGVVTLANLLLYGLVGTPWILALF